MREFSTYGEHIVNELRILCSRAQTIVKHLINNILFAAAMGKYDAENISSNHIHTSTREHTKFTT